MAQTARYPKILALGSPGIESIFDEEVEITEKIDGSQFGFGKIDGEVIVRSKNQVMTVGNVAKLFQPSFDHVMSIADKLPEGLFFYGEAMCAPRHSTLAYGRVPRNHIVLFAVYAPSSMDGQAGKMLDRAHVTAWARKLDVDAVPLIYRGMSNPEHVLSFFHKESPIKSYLGGQNIEGVVVKNYKQWLFMDQILMPVMAGKYVSKEFKEVHQKDWKSLNTGKGKFEALKDKYKSEARFHKAVMKLKEEGRLTESLRDIGELVKIVRLDLVEEEKENIKNDLWRIFADDIVKYSAQGIPAWYKEKLLLGTEQENPDEDA